MSTTAGKPIAKRTVTNRYDTKMKKALLTAPNNTMKKSTKLKLALPLLMVLFGLVCRSATATTLYSQGFETDITGWETPTRVASGTGGITSSSGNFHAITAQDAGDFTRWGGYNYGAGNNVPTVFQGYTTSVDIYLDVNAGWGNDTRFDFSSAINNSLGTHLRDFVFNGGFYNDAGGPGSNTNRFVFSAGNNAGRANSFPKNTGAIAISTTGWYTFEHHFFNNGGVLNVNMSIFDASHNLVIQWTLGTDAIGGVGGNRYGWFVSNEFTELAIDNTILRTDAVVPDSGATLSLLGLGILGIAGFSLRKRSAKV